MTTTTTNSSGIDVQLARPHALVDEPVGIQISACEPHAHVIVHATIESGDSAYTSSGRFRADENGRVDTATNASHAGSYVGIDPFGLWWSGERGGPAQPAPMLAPLVGRVRVESGLRVAETTVERPWLAAGATLRTIEERGVHGLLARPAGGGPFPAIVAFGGSGGGLGPSAGWAALLASRGFASLALGYFGAAGLPRELVGIEVEVVERAIDWLFRQPDITHRVGVIGASRGSELAMLAGVLLDNVNAVVAFAPSGVAWSGLDANGPIDAPAWTFRGRPLPYAVTARPTVAPDPRQPFALRPLFDRALQDRAMIESAEIPVERLRGPLLLVSGGADAMWPSTPMAEIAERRAERCHSTQSVVHLRYPAAGHVGIGAPGTPLVTTVRHPLTGGFYTFGGTRAANASARADSWPRVLDFLTDALV